MTGSAQPTIATELEKGTELLSDAGCESPRQDSEALLADALGVGPSDLEARAHELVPAGLARLSSERFARRQNREPVEYILGRCKFRGLELLADHRVLIPENSGPLVDAAIPLPPGARVHDVGMGSGAIALAIKHQRSDLQVTGSDVSASAVEVAQSNAARLELAVAFVVGRGLPIGEYDLVVANLPFQDERGRSLELAPELTRYQPHVAVFAGADGLEVIREVLKGIPIETMVAMKHAPSQSSRVRALLPTPRHPRAAKLASDTPSAE